MSSGGRLREEGSDDPYNVTAEQLLAPTKLSPGALRPYGADTNILFHEDLSSNGTVRRATSGQLIYGVGTTYILGTLLITELFWWLQRRLGPAFAFVVHFDFHPSPFFV